MLGGIKSREGSDSMDIKILEAGHCKQIQRIVKNNGKLRSIKFPATFVLINHPELGYILFDTGYSEHVIEKMKVFPHNIYAKITPVFINARESAKQQLLNMGIDSNSIRYIILSHFHADHIGGCLDFPCAKYICSKQDYYGVKDKTGFSALERAFIPELLPNNFKERVIYIKDKKVVNTPVISEIYSFGYDIFGDESIIAINLPGHTKGHFGIFLKSKEKHFFFIADACWQRETYEDLIFPSRIAKIIIADYNSYLNGITKLNKVYKNYPNVKIVATHE